MGGSQHGDRWVPAAPNEGPLTIRAFQKFTCVKGLNFKTWHGDNRRLAEPNLASGERFLNFVLRAGAVHTGSGVVCLVVCVC